MNIYDVIRFEGLNDDWLLFKYPEDEFNNKSQLVISPAQIAIIVHNGQIEKILEAGTYKIDSQLFPFLKGFTKFAFNGKNPYPIEIYFVNKRIKLDFLWGTSDPIEILDPQYKVKLRLRSRGQLGVKLVEYQYFYEKLVGTIMKNNYVRFDILRNYFRGIINQKIRKELSTFIISKKITYFDINMYIEDISKALEEEIHPEFSSFGFEILNFSIECIDCPEEDTDKLNEILHKRAEMEQLGDENYRTIRGYDVLEAGAKNNNGASSIMGVGLGMQMNGQMAGGIIPNAGETKKNDTITCPKCGATIAAGSKFCSECGAKIVTQCPKCGTKVTPNQKFCPECGEKLYE